MDADVYFNDLILVNSSLLVNCYRWHELSHLQNLLQLTTYQTAGWTTSHRSWCLQDWERQSEWEILRI